MAEQHGYVYKNGCHRLCAAPGCQKPKWDKCHIEPATPSGEVTQGEGPVHSKGSAVVQEQWERSKWSHDGNWRESLGDWAADLLTEYAAKYGPMDAAQPKPQPAGTEPELVSRLRQEAQIWAQEARTHKNSLLECYAAVGVHGKADFNGAEPVRQAYAALKRSHTQCVEIVRGVIDAEKSSHSHDDSTVRLERLAAECRRIIPAAAKLESK
jgi:hypothetical protein